MSSCSDSEYCRNSSKNVDGEPDRDPPAAPPIIILSKNSNSGGTQPQEQDPTHLPQPYTSFSSPLSLTPERVSQAAKDTFSSLNPKPQPEPHPAPPVIILSHEKDSVPSSRLVFSSISSSSPQTSDTFTDGALTTTTPNPADNNHRTMGSKASKLTPQKDTEQEQKDKEEMKEPSNYYTRRSKSMRKKAGKEANSDGAGATGGSAGGAGGIA